MAARPQADQRSPGDWAPSSPGASREQAPSSEERRMVTDRSGDGHVSQGSFGS